MEPKSLACAKKTDEPREKPGLTFHWILVYILIKHQNAHRPFQIPSRWLKRFQIHYVVDQLWTWISLYKKTMFTWLIHDSYLFCCNKNSSSLQQKTYKLFLTSIPKNEWPGTPGESAKEAPWWDWRKPQDSTCLVIDCVFCWLPNSHAPEACHDVTVRPLICWRGMVTPDLAPSLQNGWAKVLAEWRFLLSTLAM